MKIPDDVLCLFSAEITEQDDSYVIEVPKSELTLGDLQPGVPYGIAVVSRGDSQPSSSAEKRSNQGQERDASQPPVDVGDQRTVDIEDIGEQGDGIARVERGYVVVVPETELNERVTIEITDVTESVAFGEVLEREEYYQ